MTKTLLIITLAVLILYYCYQKENKPLNESWIWGTKEKASKDYQELEQTKQVNQTLTSFLRSQLNSNSLEELKTKLAGKSLNELLEENQDWETEVDSLTRTKNSLEQDLLAQSNAFQSRLREKDREIRRINELSKESEKQLKKLKQDLADEKKRAENSQLNLASEKQQHQGSIERITKLTEQTVSLTKEKQQAVKKLAQVTNLVNHWEINRLTKKQLTELKNLLKNE